MARAGVPQGMRRGAVRPRALYAALLMLALMVAAPGGSRGATSAGIDCSTSFDAYAASDATLAACGISAFPLVAKVALPDGGVSYRYKVHGEEAWTNIPPA